jgi:serine/threonine protein kinase
VTEREIFFEALEMTTPEARAAYLEGACGGDVALHRKLAELLKEHFSNDSLMSGPAVEAERTSTEAIEEAPAAMLGRYKLLEKIGEGGFGEVWMAEQREPIKRRVAVKIIKPGMDSRQIVARFEAERQALAMMDHANIAKVFDAGTTDGGRLYFVMELVRGIKITEYCDQNQLPTRERLKLFILACHAIQHAHQKGIIHRDIKPSNILVTLHDGVPVPKVIDFGIAKATQQELTEKTVFTQFQQFMGTPAYISPEQAEMSGLDIDTRADIYSLGVLLYELLVGQTPFDVKEMMRGGLDGLRPDHPGEGTAAAFHQTQHAAGGRPDHGWQTPSDRCGDAGAPTSRRSRLDRDEVPGEGSHAEV